MTPQFSPRYLSYMRSPAWYQKREQAFRFWGRNCLLCGSWKRVEGHHALGYKRLGREWFFEIVPLCHNCHSV